MKYILEYSQMGSFKRRGKNPADELGWADQIESHIKNKLLGKKFKNKFILKSFEMTEPRSQSEINDIGEGNIILRFQSEHPDEIEDLLGDLYDVGAHEGRVLKLYYFIEATLDDQGMYDIEMYVSPKDEKNFLGFKTKTYYDDSYDPSQGVGSVISDLVLKGIS